MITYVLGTDFIMVQAVRLETIVEKQNKNTEKKSKVTANGAKLSFS